MLNACMAITTNLSHNNEIAAMEVNLLSGYNAPKLNLCLYQIQQRGFLNLKNNKNDTAQDVDKQPALVNMEKIPPVVKTSLWPSVKML